MFFRAFSLVCLAIGVFVLVQVIAPAFAFKAWELTFLGSNNGNLLVDPNPSQTIADSQVLGVSVENVGNFTAFVSSSTNSIPYREFSISIPSIKLPKTTVKVASNEFEHSLAQLPGTALPGEIGNVFISGHSALPQFYSPDNFQAIFSELPNIKTGDDIEVDALGQHFSYQVVGLRVVNPSDVWVINPPDGIGRYMSLMTCVPPGFNTKRLIVLSKLKG